MSGHRFWLSTTAPQRFAAFIVYEGKSSAKSQAIKNHPKVVYTTLLIIDFILFIPMVPGAGLEPAQP
ncbi:hypothetical protein [Cedecea neteri]|uniref:Uncharacterized protein n=1 Tax=Cedecea neteri TaxID=158822 RepID=A0A291DWE9_9ENTR|nr:hypothetical protein [Cedecea neteri]ATF92137.1 hypothetical protein CO704_08595 [Cedecea neteri]